MKKASVPASGPPPARPVAAPPVPPPYPYGYQPYGYQPYGYQPYPFYGDQPVQPTNAPARAPDPLAQRRSAPAPAPAPALGPATPAPAPPPPPALAPPLAQPHAAAAPHQNLVHPGWSGYPLSIPGYGHLPPVCYANPPPQPGYGYPPPYLHPLPPVTEEEKEAWKQATEEEKEAQEQARNEEGKRIAVRVLELYEKKRRRVEGKRPRRLLSYVTKSQAFPYVQSEQRLQRGVGFFFPLLDISGTSFQQTAFAAEGPDSSSDENTVHHPYFIRQMKVLVDAALAANITLAQQTYWSKSGKWMSLDDGLGSGSGCEPDFCMTAVVDQEKLVPIVSEGVKPPQSKYDVTVALEMKKGFTETDQMEALDYGERLLCFQRGRRCSYAALFHCCKDQKVIRWLKTEESNGQFTTAISRPASLAPGGEGQLQLLTILTKSSAELGLDFPQITASDTNESVKITSFIGEGATSIVYAATFCGKDGVVKLLKGDFEDLADHELAVLDHLQRNGVPGIPSDVTKIRKGALFFGEELSHVDSLDRQKLSNLIDCLNGAHNAGVVHRDVRPDNVMQDVDGNVFLIDWGFAYRRMSPLSIPEFRGTFRFASDEVLTSAISGIRREPQPIDDLFSVVMIILWQSSASLQDELADIQANDLPAAKTFWDVKRKANPGHEWLFNLASSCDYDSLKGAIFG